MLSTSCYVTHATRTTIEILGHGSGSCCVDKTFKNCVPLNRKLLGWNQMTGIHQSIYDINDGWLNQT